MQNAESAFYVFSGEGLPTTNAVRVVHSTGASPHVRTLPSGAKELLLPEAGTNIVVETGLPGEYLFPVAADEQSVYFLSEHQADALCLKAYRRADGTVATLSDPHATGDVLHVAISHSDESPSPPRAVFRYAGGATDCQFFDGAMEKATRKLARRWPNANFIWLWQSPAADQWIVRADFTDRPALWLLCDLDTHTHRVIGRFRGRLTPTIRRMIEYDAADGTRITGVVSYPVRGGDHPLVVFPHGGPGSLTTTAFDERVHLLNDAGFMVFQPNYRGSRGLGKAFRFKGWKADGIRAAIEDIHAGCEAVKADASLPVSDAKSAILGGSWGGYCGLALLAMHPDAYCGCVSLFGTTDIPAMLGETPGKPEELATLSKLQLGNVEDPDEREALAAISPANLISAYASPVVLFHNKDDVTADHSQSETFYRKMLAADKEITFFSGQGSHGFTPEEEAAAYRLIAGKFHEWQNASATPHLP